MIRGYGITGTAAHDSIPYLDVLPAKAAYADQEVFADSAYSGKDIDGKLKERGFICEKGYRSRLANVLGKISVLGYRCGEPHVAARRLATYPVCPT